MTETNGIFSEEFNKYIDEWAGMQIEIWQDRMQALWVSSSPNATGNLYKSLSTKVSPDHGRIDFTFNRYGAYVDAGIGPESKLSLDHVRKRKPWLSGNYWYSKQKLKAEMLEQTGSVYLKSISNLFNDKKK
ncbi:MAG: hypothetical protein LBP72_06645 [Dysgonamonadaceae bacterium]|jgi:hypothetical protein|nr:hypothetical protein [Dysgonamonadaceae bacterium]